MDTCEARPMPTPLTVYLPFNRDVLGEAFVPGKGGARPADAEPGRWLLVQDQGLLVRRAGESWVLPEGPLPGALASAAAAPFWLGHLHGQPLRVAAVPAGVPAPDGLEAHTMIPMRGTSLPDELL